MIFETFILSQILGSMIILFFTVYALILGVKILRKWDFESAEETQLTLEKKNYLVSTIMQYMMGFHILSLVMFMLTAENLSNILPGAMCATGSLNANRYGFPLLFIKITGFFCFGLWIIQNHIDMNAEDYPLIRVKNLWLIIFSPLMFVDFVLQFLYFLHLDPQVITSCCGTLFGVKAEKSASTLVTIPSEHLVKLFFSIVPFTAATGIFYRFKPNKYLGIFYSLLFIMAFFVSILSIISFISSYIYGLPYHHCPFCVLKREYWYIGYFMYILLFGGTLFGLSIGFLEIFGRRGSSKLIVQRYQKKASNISLISIVSFFILSSLIILLYALFGELIIFV